jgi:hypothetical protein
LTAADFVKTISPADRRLMRRLSIAFALLFLFTFAFSRLDLLYSHKFFDNTGRAEWIWYNHRIASGDPLAFFATKEFDLPPNRYFTKIKLAADPEYTLWFNGREIGGRRVGEQPTLDVYDVTQLARTKGNRIVVALRSPNGVGGVIAAVDIAVDYQNLAITDASWHIVKRWTPDLLVRDPAPQFVMRPLLLGRPPARRWNYLETRKRDFTPPPQRILPPSAAFTFNTALADIDIVEGVAVAVSKKTVATAYDFAPMTGRVRLTILGDSNASRAIKVRFANERSELMTIEGVVEPVVFAPGERSIIDPQVRRFRYVMIYGGGVRAEAVLSPAS